MFGIIKINAWRTFKTSPRYPDSKVHNFHAATCSSPAMLLYMNLEEQSNQCCLTNTHLR